MTESARERGDGRARRDGDAVTRGNLDAALVNKATQNFADLTAKQIDGVTGIRRDGEQGWSILIDVVELERVPSTTTVLATYRVDVGPHGEIEAYERLRRFVRGAVDPS